MDVLLNEPYYTGSHKYWADNLVKYSSHNFQLVTMPGRYWKWRMKGSSIHLAQQFKDSKVEVDAVLCSSMMDVSLYKSLLSNELRGVPVLYYVHENQLTYPFSNNESRTQEEFHYGFTNYTSCLASDVVIFNSLYHKKQFLQALSALIKRLPDFTKASLESIARIENKSKVIYPGIDFELLNVFKVHRNRSLPPTLLWNHRWSHDKRPDLFYNLCKKLKEQNTDFRLILLNDVKADNTGIFKKLKNEFGEFILHDGLITTYHDYIKALHTADIIPVSSDHDFYGISVLEAIYCGVIPILPRNKVYEEFFYGKDHDLFFYDGEDGFFELAKRILSDDLTLFDSSKIVEIHSIHNTMNKLDLCISNSCNLM